MDGNRPLPPRRRLSANFSRPDDRWLTFADQTDASQSYSASAAVISSTATTVS